MNSDRLKYLQQDAIGKVIAQGLADVYTHKPEAPVKYLAAWLKKYSANQKEIAKLSDEAKVKQAKMKEYQEKAKESQEKAVSNKIVENKSKNQLEAFKNKCEIDQYQKEFLFKELPEFVEKRMCLTGAYVGYVKHPPREVTEEDQDENAHLDTTQPKMINYIGSSCSHADLMLKKTLLLDKGVTGGAFALSLDDPVPNEEGNIEVKEKYVYIPNVVKNQSMHYFKWPKLGSYIAVPLVYQSYLTENVFDLALDARQKFLDELADFEKEKAEALKEIENEFEAATKKLEDCQEKNDEAATEAAKAELEEVKKRKKEKTAECFNEEAVQLPTTKKEFVLCADTMGQDKQISEEKRNCLIDLIKHFRDCWEKKEKELLYKDVNYQVNIRKDQSKTPEDIIEHLTKCCEIPAETLQGFDEIEDEQLRQYKKATWQLDALKQEIKEGDCYLADFFKVKNFRVVKFRTLVQTLLYFLRYEKSKINEKGKTVIDWKHVRANYLFADTFNAFMDYNTEGPKTDNYPFYCKLQHVSQNLQKHNQAEVFKYNIGLGVLLTLVKKMIAHRISNIELRRSQKEKERQRKTAIEEENNKIVEEKQAALEKHRLSLTPEQLETFKEEEWTAKYDEENPMKETLPDVVDDIDNDF